LPLGYYSFEKINFIADLIHLALLWCSNALKVFLWPILHHVVMQVITGYWYWLIKMAATAIV